MNIFLSHHYLLSFLFTIIIEVLVVVALRKTLMASPNDLNNLCYTVIGVNLMTHPIAFLLYQVIPVYAFNYLGYLGSSDQHIYLTALSTFALLEIGVVFFESLFISFAMRYPYHRGLTIALSIQMITVLIALMIADFTFI